MSSSISDLAPLVSSVLRDKVVLDLETENALLKKQLADAKAVEITGIGGSPVYARGSLLQAAPANNPRLTRVELKMTSSTTDDDSNSNNNTAATCTVPMLRQAELRIGKVQVTNMEENTEGVFDFTDLRGKVNFFFGGTVVRLWLNVHILDWPDNDFREFVETRPEGEQMLNLLEQEASLADKAVRFHEVLFLPETVNCELLGLKGSDWVPEEDVGYSFLLHALMLLRDPDWTGEPERDETAFDRAIVMARAQSLVRAMETLHLTGPGEVMDTFLRVLIPYQPRVQSAQAFQTRVEQLAARVSADASLEEISEILRDWSQEEIPVEETAPAG